MGTASNVIVGEATLYIAPANTAIPPVPATAGATSWAVPTTPWVQSGFTESGVVLNVDRKVNDVYVDEQSTPVVIVPQTMDVAIDITFAEDTIANMVNAYGGGTVTQTTAGAATPGLTTLALSNSLTTVALVFYGVNSFGFQRQVYIPEVVSTGKVKTEYMRYKSARTYPTTFTAICDPSLIIVNDITAAVT